MGAIPQSIYQRIKEILTSRESVAVILVCPGDGEIKEAIEAPIKIIPAKD